MVRNILSFFICCSFLHTLSAQNFELNPHKFGTNLFAGGIDTPRFQFVDIDGDNDNDLFIFDRDEKLWFYRNLNGSYRLEPNGTFGIIVGSWFHFLDIDGDGDNDCLTNGSFSEVSLFTNIGSSTSPNFQLTTASLLDTSGIELFSERFSIPTFADMDGDGDDDFFTGGSIGSITYYKNIGTKFSPQFTYVTSAYQGINIQGGPGTFPKPQHGASGIEFFDVDSNGVMDLFWGDYFNPSLYFLKNSGTKENANITLVDSTYPNEAVITSFGFNFPQHVDVDRNGIIDLMVGCVFPNVDYNNFMFYKNIGSNVDPLYTLESKNFIPMIDVGSRSCVAAADFDGDGDIDLCISSSGGTISIFQNIGTASLPVYSAIPTSVISVDNDLNITIAAGDVNGNNIPDLLAGTYESGLKTFINTSTNGKITFSRQNHPAETFLPGQSSAPCVADIDLDGKTDILIGNSGGQLMFLKNIGTNTSPSYQSEMNFNSIDVGNDAIPFVKDFDHDGILDLFIGNSDGIVWHYKQNSGTKSTFDLVNKKFQNIDLKTQTAPSIVDIDADGDDDLLLGNGKGGIFIYENLKTSNIHEYLAVPSEITLYQNYPNPFNPSTTITFTIPFNAFITLKVFDMLGREITTLLQEQMIRGKHSVVWDATKYPTGTYFCHFIVETKDVLYNKTKLMVLSK